MSTQPNPIPYSPQPPAISSDAEGDPSKSVPLAGIGAAWRKLLLQAEMAAPHLQIASIEGEQGSGKQTLARYLLSRSPLARAPFQRHDAREWLLSDLDPAKLSGFLYLDRVDLLTAPGQTLLLNVLKGMEHRNPQRLAFTGHSGTEDRSPIRLLVVASSHASLRQMAGQGQFIPDLAFRLTACRFAIPPLRMRKEDISPIAQVLLDHLCTRYQQRTISLGPGTLARLLQHNWPGNVRELASVLEAAILESSGDMILPNSLALPTPGQMPDQAISGSHPNPLTLDDVIHRHVQYVLDLNHGNKLRAARQLGISRSTLYRLLENESVLTSS
ncbi:MAG TPA: sigma 54-interacting transcriptional regulator [Terracidiphilus sp.]